MVGQAALLELLLDKARSVVSAAVVQAAAFRVHKRAKWEDLAQVPGALVVEELLTESPAEEMPPSFRVVGQAALLQWVLDKAPWVVLAPGVQAAPVQGRSHPLLAETGKKQMQRRLQD